MNGITDEGWLKGTEMVMEAVKIVGANHLEKWSKYRAACRGIVVRDDKILLSYEEKTDQWFIPGGGVEGKESLKDCCQREVAEETGVLVSVGEQYLTMQEFYEEWFFESHFFICEAVGETERRLTKREQEVGLVPRWLPLKEAVSIFSRHQEYASTDEMKRGAYLREYTALLKYGEMSLNE